jgi:ATP-dependent Lhr-like helicase
MSLDHFHPLIRRWFSETLGEPTAAQSQGWAAIRKRRHTLIAAPTGSGKTLAAFLTAIGDLFEEGLAGPLPDEVRVVYISPLKALSTDIHKNLAEPCDGIRRLCAEAGLEAPRITSAVRTGDTTTSERASMLRRPPHILVTTPESLYLLLTAERSREMLRSVRTVIVDEIHAVIGTRRGAHLAITLERLQQVVSAPLLRLGLSATQKPIDEVARFLVGTGASEAAPECTIVDEGHRRAMDLSVEMPRSNLDAVMSHEVWEEYYDRLTALISEHKTTLVFVNTRKMAERVARHLSDRLGEDAVTAHHGSLSKDSRLDAETRLKSGRLRALVATASLELGIDIGHVDLVCQIGSPHRIATLLQRVGRSGHTVSGLPKGRVFPASRDDLVECAALLRSVRRGELDRFVEHDAPLDVLAQQLVAESSCDDYTEDDLFALVRRAWPYRALARRDFDAVVTMVSDGFATRRGRRGALVHRDEVNHAIRGRRGSRMLSITSGGAIPEVADYRVILEGEETFIGTLNEDFAIESNAGDIFQLGNASWQILQVQSGVVRVADAKGAPPTIPFWLGEAPARSDELSTAVSDLRSDLEAILACSTDTSVSAPCSTDTSVCATSGTWHTDKSVCAIGVSAPGATSAEWLIAECGIPLDAATTIVAYLDEARRALGILPTQQTLVLERFFDESGGMQLVLHSPFGSRINKAWGLALRKRFCRQFNFELQAAATEDALLLSLGTSHSFPLADVFRYLHPATCRDILVQAFLDAPVFQTRWRWNATISLAIPRNRGGKKVPPQLQRMQADDLMAAVFPDAAACFENIAGDRQLPDHPLVNQAVRDCLEEAMDFDGLAKVLERIHSGQIVCVARDTAEPSVLTHEILNAKPYAFLDDAPLEERRTQAVYTRRAGAPSSAGDLGALDQAAIDRVRDEERPDPRDADELHDILLTVGFLTTDEVEAIPKELFQELVKARRAGIALCANPNLVFPSLVIPSASLVIPSVSEGSGGAGGAEGLPQASKPMTVARDSSQAATTLPLWIAAERLPELQAVHPDATIPSALAAPASRTERTWSRGEAIVELLRGRMTILGPATPFQLARAMAIEESDVDTALLALEGEGVVLRGSFTPRALARARTFETLVGYPSPVVEWCDRRLLARIHRYTLNRLRSEIEPAGVADFVRFLFDWQHVAPSARLSGAEGLSTVIGQLDGFEVAASAWERTILPARMDRYEPSLLDMLCLTGEVGWGRLSPPTIGGSQPRLEIAAGSGPTPAPLLAAEGAVLSRIVGVTPIALFLRQNSRFWQALRVSADRDPQLLLDSLSGNASAALEVLSCRGASFSRDVAAACDLDDQELSGALAELVSAGLVVSDGFAGLRALIQAAPERQRPRDSRTALSGRWSIVGEESSETAREMAVEAQALGFLRRYGIVFRRIVAREANAAPWRELTRVYRRLEARGEIRGGRFVAGMSGEQFASKEAVERLREIRRQKPDGAVVVISAADPLNLTGILMSNERVRAIAGHRIAWRDGIAVSVMEGDSLRPLAELPDDIALQAAAALAGRRVNVASGYVGRRS